MRALAALLILSIAGCVDTRTRVYEGGSLVLSTGADMQSVSFRTPGGTQLTGVGVNHSTPILANGTAVATILDAAGRLAGVVGAAVVGGILAVPHPAAAATSAVVPAAASHVNGMVNPPSKVVHP